MKEGLGEAFSILIGVIAFAAVIAVFLTLFILPDKATGLPDAFSYFSGIFTRYKKDDILRV